MSANNEMDDAITASQVSEIYEDVEIYEFCEQFEGDGLNCSRYDDSLNKACDEIETTIMHSSKTSDTNELSQEHTEMEPKKMKNEDPTLKPKIDLEIVCGVCNINVNRLYIDKHITSNIHKNNIIKTRKSKMDMTIVESALGPKIVTYKISNNIEGNFETDVFFDSIRQDIRALIDDSMQLHTVFKVNFVLVAEFVRERENDTSMFDFQTNNVVIFKGDDFERVFANLRTNLTKKIVSFERRSGLSLLHIRSIDMRVNKFYPITRNFYFE